ncbi:cytosolic 5'-nucleotidase 1A-like isoform X1 [Thunnus albacares]|uniref:cytosolic 5'-nucleotidase 1A-like isoform X1 n=1 Tax=Thunnus albacares TaxID=8236 RepID=UPI001CF6FAAF|nr:cytosolic 5'-nucleotidase 1A-like isoform X1 [Thunnus albacares]XP_044231080.1 cytosolic 5'-nucleotidase 1A-like isoform X1 [Thunnus albacares]XP_044231081.1 cytosolic 5'-nucleotidase 1A-like isoform X1 [Thunnus albacares]
MYNMSTQTRSKRKDESEPEIPITIAMSSEVLFNMEKEQQSSRSMSHGPAFYFVKALQVVNAELKVHYPESQELFKVLLINHHSSDSDRLNETIKIQACCLFSSARKTCSELEELITPLVMERERLVSELKKNKTHLYLSAKPGFGVQEALKEGIAAAIMGNPETIAKVSETQLRIVFDGDAVLFSDESQRVFNERKLMGYLEHEKKNVDVPMNQGPFRGLLEVLERLQRKLHNKGLIKNCPIRTYLVTSRDAGCAGYRALNTLHSWGLEIDEAVFLGGSPKGPVLEKIRPHIFFDDQDCHIKNVLKFGIVACHVQYSSE